VIFAKWPARSRIRHLPQTARGGFSNTPGVRKRSSGGLICSRVPQGQQAVVALLGACTGPRCTLTFT